MTLDQIALLNGTDKASSHHDYCRVYEPLFEPMREKPISLLEIGCQFGFSIKTWLEYFPNAYIYGVDIVDQFKTDDARYRFEKGDIGDETFWASYPWPPLDIVIDDGPHVVGSSIIAFASMWPKLKSGGLWIIEDIFTWWDENYQSAYGGRPDKTVGIKTSGFLYHLIGQLNQYGKSYFGKPTPAEPLVGMETEIEFVHFHRGLVIIKKK